MQKNEVFTFTAPNGVEVTAVCLHSTGCVGNMVGYLCYAQNRLFTLREYTNKWVEETGEVCEETSFEYGEVIADYAILPDYDVVLEDHYLIDKMSEQYE